MIKYCESIFQTKRRKTREVKIGLVKVGGDHPVRTQSMTTSSTRDVEATIEQLIRLADAGCEIARVTVQGMKEAEACEAIKNGLIQKGYLIPLVADIHFFPPAAMRVVDFVDKVRINPGNYVDKRALFKLIEYNDEIYKKEIEKIEEKFSPLVEKCKKLKKAMRIGTNHGSLSDRIMNRYGDTPKGMVESALEFARVCRKLDYHDFLFSMKASNPLIMIQAYRLLVAEMNSLGWDYPLHLGVTEAGEGEDGRIKSAMGIGTLLLDGLGDTIRVSLTEDPWNEIEPCLQLIAFAKQYEGQGVAPFEEKHRHFQSIQRRTVRLPKTLSLHREGSVFVQPTKKESFSPDFYKKLGCGVELSSPKLTLSSTDAIIINEKEREQDCVSILNKLKEIGITLFSPYAKEGEIPLLSLQQAFSLSQHQAKRERFASPFSENGPLVIIVQQESEQEWEKIKDIHPALIILAPPPLARLHYCRQFFDWLQTHSLLIPVILRFDYDCSKEELIIQSATEYGALLCDGLGEGIWIDALYDVDFLRQLSFNLLQSARMRTFKTDFISCPSCGRTLFDLQDVSKRIRERTSHLAGVKIAIMGCIVNGPGEMADADFGYVGSKPGMIDLYVGKQCIEKDICFSDADDRLVELIKTYGRWTEPS